MSRRERIDPVPPDYSEKRVSPIVENLARYVASRAATLLSIAEKERNQLKAIQAIQKIGRSLAFATVPTSFEDWRKQFETSQKVGLCSYYAGSVNGQFGWISINLRVSKAAGSAGTTIEGEVGPVLVSHHAMVRTVQAFKPKTHAELLNLMRVMLLVSMQTNQDEQDGGRKSIEFDGHLLHFKRRSDEDMLVLATIIEESRRDLR
jgi:hypothetical protein